MSMKFAFNRLYSYRLLLLIMAVILVIPFVVVTYPPCTDLPQHLAQITLLKQAVHDHTGTLTVQWIAPNVLVYYLMPGLSFIFPPVPAGNTIMVLMVLVWIILSLATKRHRLKQETDFPLLIASGLMILSFPDTSRQMHQYHRFRPARAPVRHDHAGYIPARPPYQHPAALASSSHIHRFFLPGDDDPVDTFRPG